MKREPLEDHSNLLKELYSYELSEEPYKDHHFSDMLWSIGIGILWIGWGFYMIYAIAETFKTGGG